MNTLEGADLGNLPPCVEAIFTRRTERSFFQLPQWFGLIADCATDGKTGRVNVAFDESVRIAMVYGRSRREVHSLTNLYTCAYDILGDEAGGSAIRQFAKQFALGIQPGSRIRLEGIELSAPSFNALLSGFRDAGFLAKPYFAWGTWYERTDNCTFDHFVATRTSMLRNTWARKRAALERESRAKFRIYRGDDDIAAYIAAYEDIHRRSWKPEEPYPRFIPELVRLAAKFNALRFGVLDIDGVAAAAQFWIVWARKATVYKLVYADDMSAFSPGTVLTMEMFRRVLEEDRPVEIDFGRGDDRYKEMWLTSRREHWGIEAASPRTLEGLADAGWIALGLGRDFLRETLTKGASALGRRPSKVKSAAPPVRP